MSKNNEKNGTKKALKVVAIIICALVGLILLFLLGVRLYFRLPVKEYYSNSEKAFVIPGTSDNMIHQGLTYDSKNNTFLITAYKAADEASQLSVVSETDGKELKRLELTSEDGSPFTGHVGGITVYGDYVYVADSEGLVAFDRDDIIAASNGDSVRAIGLFKTSNESDKLEVAFTHVEGDMIYVGEFYREENYPTPDSHKYKTAAGDENPALILAYKLDSAAPYGISDSIERAYSIPGLVQGMCFDADGRIYLSTSYAVAFSHVCAYESDKEEGSITVLGQTVPLYVLDSSTRIADIKLPPMAEEIVIVDGKLYTMCESASNKYIFGKFTSAKFCYATDISQYIRK